MALGGWSAVPKATWTQNRAGFWAGERACLESAARMDGSARITSV